MTDAKTWCPEQEQVVRNAVSGKTLYRPKTSTESTCSYAVRWGDAPHGHNRARRDADNGLAFSDRTMVADASRLEWIVVFTETSAAS